ncbi:MAG: hypothetical protein M3347_01055 [Armatimonadota bacterium]|nr:hypothetical protein [Armatimonadota bacterium]
MLDEFPSPLGQQAGKMTWFIIVFSMVVSVGIYGLLGFLLSQNRTPRAVSPSLGTLRPILYILAVVMLLASVAWITFRTQGKTGGVPDTTLTKVALLSPPQFQTETIVGLSLAEACAIFGLLLFFMGAPLTEFALFAAGTLAVDLLFILPKGIAYWAAWENQQKRESDIQPFS